MDDHKAGVGRIGDIPPVGGGRAKLRLADRKHRQRITIGSAVGGDHIDGNGSALPRDRDFQSVEIGDFNTVAF